VVDCIVTGNALMAHLGESHGNIEYEIM